MWTGKGRAFQKPRGKNIDEIKTSFTSYAPAYAMWAETYSLSIYLTGCKQELKKGRIQGRQGRHERARTHHHECATRAFLVSFLFERLFSTL